MNFFFLILTLKSLNTMRIKTNQDLSLIQPFILWKSLVLLIGDPTQTNSENFPKILTPLDIITGTIKEPGTDHSFSKIVITGTPEWFTSKWTLYSNFPMVGSFWINSRNPTPNCPWRIQWVQTQVQSFRSRFKLPSITSFLSKVPPLVDFTMGIWNRPKY